MIDEHLCTCVAFDCFPGQTPFNIVINLAREKHNMIELPQPEIGWQNFELGNRKPQKAININFDISIKKSKSRITRELLSTSRGI